MSRLFITEREIEFVNDITKEVIKDIIGQTINYYPISVVKSEVHAVYNEAVKKVYENPIRLNALVSQPEWESKTTGFGPDVSVKIEVLLQARDLADKKITLAEGDMFTFDDVVYEVLTYTNMNNLFGFAEYNNCWKISGRTARLSQLDPTNLPLPRMAPEGVQNTFEQQRGLPVSSTGEPTGDVRQLRERLKEDMPEIALGSGAAKVAPHTNELTGDEKEGNAASSFVSDPLPPKKGIYDD